MNKRIPFIPQLKCTAHKQIISLILKNLTVRTKLLYKFKFPYINVPFIIRRIWAAFTSGPFVENEINRPQVIRGFYLYNLLWPQITPEIVFSITDYPLSLYQQSQTRDGPF